MKTTLQSFLEKSEGFPHISSRAIKSYTSDFMKGVELEKHDMWGYYLAKEMLYWYAENCSVIEEDYQDAKRFHKKRYSAYKMRMLIEFEAL